MALHLSKSASLPFGLPGRSPTCPQVRPSSADAFFSPDLAYDRSRDWSIYCLDPLEQPLGPSMANKDATSSIFSGAMTGMGLVSHALAEDDRTLTPVSVTGKVIEDQGTEALEVILQMKAVSLFMLCNQVWSFITLRRQWRQVLWHSLVGAILLR